jgi:radical SAM protein with 4Fe4S-binding SPASM domain
MKMKVLYSPMFVVWEITLDCNLNCIHCGSNAGEKRRKELTTEESLKVCQDLAKLGFKGIGLMGGEIFLRKDWNIIGKEIKDLGMSLSIITNGFFNPEKIVSQMARLETDCVTVGFDGTEKVHDHIRGMKGSFKKALNFMKSSKEAGLLTNAITTVHKINYGELKKLTKVILEDEQLDWQIQEALPIGRFPKEYLLSEEEFYSLGIFITSLQKKYSKEKVVGGHGLGFFSSVLPELSLYPEWNGCYAGKSVLGIASDGSIRGCETLPEEYIEGNVRERSIIDIWNDPNSFSYTRNFQQNQLGPLCQDCKHGLICKGGCTCRSVSTTGKPHNDPRCFHRIEKEFEKTKK